MEDIRLSDEYKVEDRMSPKGVVVIRDENGNILFKGNNMVVKTGRELLFNLFLGTSGAKKFSDLNAFIGNNSVMAAANDTFISSGDNAYTSITASQSRITIASSGTTYKRRASQGNSLEVVSTVNPDDFMLYYDNSGNRLCGAANTLYYIVDSNRPYIHMGINYTPSSPVDASTFGLYFNNSGNTLFSRIVFPKRTLASNTPLIIDYYLYF